MARELTKPYYECHVTMHGDPTHIKRTVEGLGWKYSAIDGDIVLGDGVKCYSTAHFNADKFPKHEVTHFVRLHAEQLKRHDIVVIRQKVEHVVYDERITH